MSFIAFIFALVALGMLFNAYLHIEGLTHL